MSSRISSYLDDKLDSRELTIANDPGGAYDFENIITGDADGVASELGLADGLLWMSAHPEQLIFVLALGMLAGLYGGSGYWRIPFMALIGISIGFMLGFSALQGAVPGGLIPLCMLGAGALLFSVRFLPLALAGFVSGMISLVFGAGLAEEISRMASPVAMGLGLTISAAICMLAGTFLGSFIGQRFQAGSTPLIGGAALGVYGAALMAGIL